MLKILGKASSINVRKVLWAADEIGVSYEREDWGSGFQDTQTEKFRKLNPNALVPVLIDGDFVLWESNAIIRYLCASNNADDLLPSDPKARAQIEKWMDWQATEFNNSWRYPFQGLIRKNPAYQDPEKLAAGVAEWNRHVGIVEAQLSATGSYIAGDRFTLADIPIGLSVNRWFMAPIEGRPEFSAVSTYYERLSARPAFLAHGRNGMP